MNKFSLTTSLTLLVAPGFINAQAERPNILCITVEDISPRLGCYGDTVARTPNLDAFAKESIRYTHMYTTVGVSSPSRAALITGMYPTSIGANYMRNNGPQQYLPEGITSYEVVLPPGIKCFTEMLRQEGYYCTNNAKTDYQFSSPLTAWDESGTKAHWRKRPEGTPFFAIFNLDITHESRIWMNSDKPLHVDPQRINVPPYLHDNEVTRHDMAVMYSNIYEMDRQFQRLYDELKESGELENTIVIWYSDNGGSLPREKRAIYESGMLVPFMIRFPDKFRAGETEDRLCMFPDIPATILSLSGIRPPDYMHGIPFLGKYEGEPRDYVFGARDRMDEQIDKQGAVRDRNFRYVRNYYPERRNYLSGAYRLQMPMMRKMIELLGVDSLNADQMRWFVSPRNEEEFYDLEKDLYELRNQIANPAYREEIARMRTEYESWLHRYSPDWFLPEIENRNKMWPHGVQPELRKPKISQTKKGIQLSSDDEGVSFAYQIDGKGYSPDHWFLYNDERPIILQKGQELSVIAVRAGMKNSETILYRKK